jgi:histidinol-phosphate/aromatic aminotransferase/cobyric acid decarboxylase-like protein
MITEAMVANAHLWHKYPPGQGTPELRAAIKGWLDRRYDLPENMIHRDDHIIPVAGTREALYLIATCVIPQDQPGPKPKVLLPNPFYQVYCGAAVLNDAEMVPLAATPETGFLPDLDQIDDETLSACRLFFLCSPANPQGAVASRNYLERIIALARKHNFVLAMDECYADIYDRDAPTGALEICAAQNGNMDNVLVFHSLSKRSSAPGLRSGFVAGVIVRRPFRCRSWRHQPPFGMTMPTPKPTATCIAPKLISQPKFLAIALAFIAPLVASFCGLMSVTTKPPPKKYGRKKGLKSFRGGIFRLTTHRVKIPVPVSFALPWYMTWQQPATG